ncbi:hypothetical protein P692DRAFT_201903342 [Suillus brevipes Sb2]|nr:hypothetical protein P692DRAFT_201903342 [Suillus brevipes Sb2]
MPFSGLRQFTDDRQATSPKASPSAEKAIALFNADQQEEAMLLIKELAAACPNADILGCRVVETYLHVQLGTKASHHDEAADHFTTAVNAGALSSEFIQTYEDLTVLFGWDLGSLQLTAHQKRCQAFLSAGKPEKALEAHKYMMDSIDESAKASCLVWSNGKSASSPIFHSAFKQECSALCAANGDVALAASDYDRAINLYSAAITLNSASSTVFANRSKARLGKMLWMEALLDAQKVGAHKAVHLLALAPHHYGLLVPQLANEVRVNTGRGARQNVFLALKQYGGWLRLRFSMCENGTYRTSSPRDGRVDTLSYRITSKEEWLRSYTNFFRPSMHGAREKLHWASTRVTTRQEDIAYSLFGIFGVRLPVDYGKKQDKALGRLLQEIVARSGDITGLDWVGKSSEFNSCLPASITSYRVPPCKLPLLPEDEMHSSVSSLRKTVTVDFASNLYTQLRNMSAPRFATQRLCLPCIAFNVREVKRGRSPALETQFTYRVKADGLRSLDITTKEILVQFWPARPIARKFILVRPWDRSLLELPEFVEASDFGDNTESEDDYGMSPSSRSHDLSGDYPGKQEVVDQELQAFRLLARLGQPFSAFLLAQQRSGEYKRIASDHDIIGQVNDVGDLMDIRTIEIL